MNTASPGAMSRSNTWPVPSKATDSLAQWLGYIGAPEFRGDYLTSYLGSYSASYKDDASAMRISRATQIIDSTAEWELRELQTFTSTLAGQTHVSADTHPLRPAIHASALWQATSVVAGDAARRALVLRTAAGVMAGLLKNAWAAACTVPVAINAPIRTASIDLFMDEPLQ